MTTPYDTDQSPLRLVARAYASALDSWHEANEGEEDVPQFWSLSFDIGEELLRSAAREVVDDIRLGIVRHEPAAKCILLFYLLKTRLSSAQGNRFWPVVSDGLAGLTGEALSGNDIGAHYRSCLEREFPDQLARVSHFFRFVYLCFSESGAGKDRTRLIRDFFRLLVARYPGGYEGHERVEYCDDLLQEHIDSSKREQSDIKSLSGLMQRSGYELLGLMDELRARPDLVSLRRWDWSMLREFWFDETGVDLERLLPEAQEVFFELLPSIAAVLTRSELRRLLRQTNVQAIFPRSVKPADSEDLSTMAVGPVTLVSEDDERSESYVREDCGLNAHQIMERPRGSWNEVSRRYLIWRERKFTIRTSPWTVEDAFPFFANTHFDLFATPAGWFWASDRDLEYVPEDIVTGARPAIEATLRVSYRWNLTDEGLQFWIKGFSLAHTESNLESTLFVDSTEIWSGAVQGQSWQAIGYGAVLADVTADIVVRLEGGGTTVASRRFRSPVVNGGALFRRGLCRNDILLDKSEVEDLRLITDRAVGRPKASGFEIVRIDEFELDGINTTAYRFVLSDQGVTDYWISSGSHKWNIRLGPFASIVPSLPESIAYEDVQVVPTGKVHAASRNQSFILQLHIPPDWAGGPNELNRLVVTSGNRTLAVALTEVMADTEDADKPKIDLMRLLEQRQFEPAYGLMRVSLDGPAVNPFIHTSIFFLKGDPIARPCALGEHAHLEFVGDAKAYISLQSLRPATINSLNGRIGIARALLSLGEEDEIRFAWRPSIDDVAIVSNGEQLTEDPIELFAHDMAIDLVSMDQNARNFGIRVDEQEEQSFDEVIIDLRKFFKRMAANGELSGLESLLTVVDTSQGRTIREWRIGYTPSLTMTDLRWEQDAGTSMLVVECEVRGLPCQLIELALMNRSGEVIAEKEFAVSEAPSRTLHIAYPGVPDEGPVLLVASRCGTELLRIPIPDVPEITDHSPESLKASVKALVANWLPDKHHVVQLLRLFDRYIASSGRVPWPAKKVSRAISSVDAVEANVLAEVGLLLLECFSTDQEATVAYEVPLGRETLDLVVATLAIGEQLRLRDHGLMLPARVDKCSEVFFAAANDGPKRDWCISMECLCARLCDRESRFDEGSTVAALERAVDKPLVHSDYVLLEKLQELREAHTP